MFRAPATLFDNRTKSAETIMALRTTASMILLASLGAAGCDDDATSPAPADLAMPVAAGDLAAPAADLSMAIGPAADLSVAADDLAVPPGPPPLVVDDNFAASGFEGGGDVAGTITDDQTCPMRAGGGHGHCHHIEWAPGTNSWGGVVWQYPANNWGGAPGFAVPQGYAQVRFRAWGKTGGEKVSFVAGLGAGGVDQFQSRLDVALGAQPTEYVLGVRGAYADKVVSGFGWVTSAGAAETFYVDDILWTGDDDGALAPLAVEPTFAPTGFIGDGASGFVHSSACAAGTPSCRHFEWDPNGDGGGASQGWAGVFWQSAPGDWAGANDPDGAAIAGGFREIRFVAQSTHAAGQVVSFLAGMGAGTHDGWQSKLDVQLSATKKTYALGVGGAYGAHVVGGFGWVAGGSGLGVDLDGASWR
ncbi:MAG TPA: hypothetical protein VF334_13635 [Polyangia bacterium]